MKFRRLLMLVVPLALVATAAHAEHYARIVRDKSNSAD